MSKFHDSLPTLNSDIFHECSLAIQLHKFAQISRYHKISIEKRMVIFRYNIKQGLVQLFCKLNLQEENVFPFFHYQERMGGVKNLLAACSYIYFNRIERKIPLLGWDISGVLEVAYEQGAKSKVVGQSRGIFKEHPLFGKNFGEISAKVEGQLPPFPPVSNNPVSTLKMTSSCWKKRG